jgi:hypothetical protein
MNKDGFNSRKSFFAAYVGPSMNPTLREPELLEIVPYGSRPMKVGDVVLFLSPEHDQQIVHRIIRLSPKGIITRGDNNSQEDPYCIKPDNILGRAVAAWRGSNRRTIAGGRQGLWLSRWIGWQRKVDKSSSFLLHPIYNDLWYRKYLAHILPKRFRPRVVVFQVNGESRPYILIGKSLVGRFDGEKKEWQIRRPFKLIVNQDSLSMAYLKIKPL